MHQASNLAPTIATPAQASSSHTSRLTCSRSTRPSHLSSFSVRESCRRKDSSCLCVSCSRCRAEACSSAAQIATVNDGVYGTHCLERNASCVLARRNVGALALVMCCISLGQTAGWRGGRVDANRRREESSAQRWAEEGFTQTQNLLLKHIAFLQQQTSFLARSVETRSKLL